MAVIGDVFLYRKLSIFLHRPIRNKTTTKQDFASQ